MNDNYEKELAEQVDRLLKGLPDIPAPRHLGPRVLRSIAARAELPWYHQAWPAWPMALQALSLAVLLGGFGTFVYAAWQLTQAAGYQAAWEEVRETLAGFASIAGLAKVIVLALVHVIKQLGTPFLLGCIFAMGLAYSLFIGLGTVYCRVAFALRRSR